MLNIDCLKRSECVDDYHYVDVIERVFAWSKARNYAGHSKHDALNSPLLSALTFNNRFLRFLAIQSVMRFPVNIRPLLGVPRLRNPKGIGLFAHAYLDLAEYVRTIEAPSVCTADYCIQEAERLLVWLREYPPCPLPPGSRVLQGRGWGYHYDWQDVGFLQKKDFPNRVVSCWIGFAFVRAYEVIGDAAYLDVAKEIVAFLLNNPKRLVDEKEQLCLSYVPLEEIDWAVMDVSALCAALCARVAFHDESEHRLLGDAKRLIHFVVDKQTDYGAWFYTWPARDSHIKHDNYHTGIILDCLADYMRYSRDHAYEAAYGRGLNYYREHLFLDTGAPKWMNDKRCPHNIHGAAAGILAFTRAARYYSLEASARDGKQAEAYGIFAQRIMHWTLKHLYHPSGYFYYQKGRVWTKKFCLMRWCNAWMCRALAQWLTRSA